MGSLTKMATVLLWTAGALMTFAVPAMAQDTAWGGALVGNRPIELSIGGAGVVSWATSGVGIRIRLAIPLDERRSIEIFAGPYHDATTDGVVDGIRASYGFEYTRRLDRARRPGFELFLSSGGEGAVVHEDYASCPLCPHRTYVIPPVVGMLGFGLKKTLSPHLALRVEAQGLVALVIPVGVRAGISLSIPLGQAYETATRTVRR